MIYLATPYTHEDPKVIQDRFERVTRVTGRLLERGEAILSPITHCHEIALRYKLPTNWEWWMKIDREYLSKCDKMYIFNIEGWETSKGVNAEIAICKELGIDVYLINEDNLELELLYVNAPKNWMYFL